MQNDDKRAVYQHKTLRTLKIILEIVVVLFAVLLTVYLFPQIMRLKQVETRNAVRDFIWESGIWGILFMIGIQLLQIFLSVIPGEPVEVLFGFIYGPWLGALLCLLSIALGSFLVFCITRALGSKFMARVEQSGKYEKLSFLKDPRKRDALVFLLFFIPGTPKDTLTYFVPFTRMELGKFLLLSTIARIPSVITSTFAGESIFSGNYLHTILIFAITGVVGILGIFIYNRFTIKNQKKRTDI